MIEVEMIEVEIPSQREGLQDLFQEDDVGEEEDCVRDDRDSCP